MPEGDLVYPVNALAFHPVSVQRILFSLSTQCEIELQSFYRYGTMATGGSDGTVAVWDHRAKKRVKLYNRLPTAVSALAFSADGSRLAIGVSSMHDAISEGRQKQLKDKGDDSDHISIVIKSVGEELKVYLFWLFPLNRHGRELLSGNHEFLQILSSYYYFLKLSPYLCFKEFRPYWVS